MARNVAVSPRFDDASPIAERDEVLGVVRRVGALQ